MGYKKCTFFVYGFFDKSGHPVAAEVQGYTDGTYNYQKTTEKFYYQRKYQGKYRNCFWSVICPLTGMIICEGPTRDDAKKMATAMEKRYIEKIQSEEGEKIQQSFKEAVEHCTLKKLENGEIVQR